MSTVKREAPRSEREREVQELEATLPRRTRSREIWVGILAVVGTVGVIVSLLLLTDASYFRGRYEVISVVPDAGGLRKGDPVQMRGVNVGRVKNFAIRAGGVAIDLEILPDYVIPVDSRMVLRSSGLLGGRVADIVPGNAEEGVSNGDTIPGSSGGQSLEDATTDLTAGAETALSRINSLLSEPTVDALGQSASTLRTTLGDLSALVEQQRREVAAMTASLRQSAAAVEDATAKGQLAALTTNLDSMSQRLNVTSASLGRATASLEMVMGRMERGEGTLGKLSKDDALYANLNEAAVSLRTLLDDIKANPKKYLSVKVF